MMYVNLKRPIDLLVLGESYHFDIGDRIRLDLSNKIAYHLEKEIHFDIDESEYNCIQ